MKMRKRTVALIALVLALVCVSIPVFLYLLGGNNRRVKLIVVGKTSTTTVEFWRSVHDGMAEAAGDFNVEYEFISMSDESDVEGQKKLLAQAAKSAPDAIVWIAADYEMAEEAAALSETGIPFVLMDSDVNYTGGSKKSFVGTDNYAAALAAGLRAGDGRYGRKAAILVHAAYSKTGADRTRGFREGFLSYAGNEIVEVLDCGNSTPLAREQTKKILAEHPDVDVILNTNEVVTLGCLPEVIAAGKAREISLFAFDCSKLQIQYVEEGILETIVAQYPFRMGYLAIRTAREAALGHRVSPEVDTGSVLVDADNIYDKANQEILFPFK